MQLQKFILANQGKVRLQFSDTSTVHLAAVRTVVIQVKAKRYNYSYHYRLGPGDTAKNKQTKKQIYFQSFDAVKYRKMKRRNHCLNKNSKVHSKCSKNNCGFNNHALHSFSLNEQNKAIICIYMHNSINT